MGGGGGGGGAINRDFTLKPHRQLQTNNVRNDKMWRLIEKAHT